MHRCNAAIYLFLRALDNYSNTSYMSMLINWHSLCCLLELIKLFDNGEFFRYFLFKKA